MKHVTFLKWESAVAESRIHAERLQVAVSKVAKIMPLDTSLLADISDQDCAWLDQFLFRFSKLQDALGDRVFIAGLLLLGEDFRDKPLLDALNRLESLGVLPSRTWWQELRELRNQIAHEYPDRRQEQADAVNAVFEVSLPLVRIFDEFVSLVNGRL